MYVKRKWKEERIQGKRKFTANVSGSETDNKG
jgi:hypothetical protein